MSSLVPRPLPDFISLAAVEKTQLRDFLHSCKIKSGSGLGTRLTITLKIIYIQLIKNLDNCGTDDQGLTVIAYLLSNAETWTRKVLQMDATYHTNLATS